MIVKKLYLSFIAQHQQLHKQQQKQQQKQLPNRIPTAAKERPLFAASQVALLRMSSKIDDLTQTTQSLVNLQQNRSRSESPFTNNGQIIAANRPGPPNSARSSSQSVGRTYFRQHLFNNIFRAKCSNAFTAVGIMDHPFDHFVTEAPVKVYEIIGKFFSFKSDFLRK